MIKTSHIANLFDCSESQRSEESCLHTATVIYQHNINFNFVPGILNVYIKPEDIAFDGTLTPKFTKSGNQGDKWFQGIVQLPTMNIAFQVSRKIVIM